MTLILFILLFISFNLCAQTDAPSWIDSLRNQLRQEILDSVRSHPEWFDKSDELSSARLSGFRGKFELGIYLETYYQFDFNRPADQNRPPFVYSHNRHNEFNLNLGVLRASWTSARFRTSLAIMAGTYAQANLAAEPAGLRMIREATAGFNLLRKGSLWLEGGIFSSHIGFESAEGSSCFNLTRSILADNSPYYESGLRLSWQQADEKVYAALLLLNGWQQIRRTPGSTLPSAGWQLQFRPLEGLLLNSSSYIGPQGPDETRRMRYFHNFYLQYDHAPSGFSMIAGLDAGIQQRNKGVHEYAFWYSPVLILRQKAGKKCFLSYRSEYYRDREGVIIASNTPNGFGVLGNSLNLDVVPFAGALVRAEGKLLYSPRGKSFEARGKTYELSPSVTVAMCWNFSKKF